jgi:hypothetical protein
VGATMKLVPDVIVYELGNNVAYTGKKPLKGGSILSRIIVILSIKTIL